MAGRAYVDGFNLYHSLVRNRPKTKWLDFSKLWRSLLPDTPIEHTYYFTARVHPMPLDRGAPARQQRLLDALGSIGVEVVLGTFRQDRIMARPTHGSIRDRIEVHRSREKASDVNLASYLLRDAYMGAVDTAVVVSNDSDLLKPVSFAREAGVNVILCSPTARPSSALVREAAEHYVLTSERLEGCQFPPTIVLPTGREVHRPREWA
ncbi:MAG: NYN domain-containing protein [Chloroflexi bacterium]|nr:NYN domain-containing protein [Chloroflexota bacterium]